jgi:hypothetical protein
LILDTNGNCVNPPVIPATCSEGFHSDGDGNCIRDNVPLSVIECGSGYHSDGSGHCILDATALMCSTGFKSDGNGVCVSIAPTLVSASSKISSVVYTPVGSLFKAVDTVVTKS